MSVYCDWVRWKLWSATSVSVWMHVKLSEIHSHVAGTLSNQPTNKLTVTKQHLDCTCCKDVIESEESFQQPRLANTVSTCPTDRANTTGRCNGWIATLTLFTDSRQIEVDPAHLPNNGKPDAFDSSVILV